MRFLHTSDWHLGRLFHNVHMTEDQHHILMQFIDLVRDAKLDAVIIAGDIYDRAVPPSPAVEILDEVISKLIMEIGVPTIIIAGNHDSPERLGFGARLLRDKGLIISGTLHGGLDGPCLDDAHGPVHIATMPFAMPEVVREWSSDDGIRGHEEALGRLIEHTRASIPKNTRSIAVAHAFVTGGTVSDSERSLSVGGSDQVPASLFDGFDYVALGHLHRPQKIGAKHIRYSGSLLKYSFSEIDHRKSMSIVDMDAQGAISIEEVHLKPRRDLRSVKGTLEEVLAAAPHDLNKDDYLLAVLSDREPLLNPMAKLREFYPNTLHIERPHFGAATEGGLGSRDHRKMTTLELFETFWKQTRDDDLGDARRDVLVETIKKVDGASQ